MSRLVQLWRHPLKSARGESLRQAHVGPGGVAGDRRWEVRLTQTLLRLLARRYRIQLPGLGAAACFGTYAGVIRPGEVQVGQTVQVIDRV